MNLKIQTYSLIIYFILILSTGMAVVQNLEWGIWVLLIILGVVLLFDKISFYNYFIYSLLFLTGQVMTLFLIDLIFNITRVAGQFTNLIIVLKDMRFLILYTLFPAVWYICKRKFPVVEKILSKQTKRVIYVAIFAGIPLWMERIFLFIAAALCEKAMNISDQNSKKRILDFVITLNEALPLIRFIFYMLCFLCILLLGILLLLKRIKLQSYFWDSFIFLCIEVMGLFTFEVLLNHYEIWGVLVVVENLFLKKHFIIAYCLFPLLSFMFRLHNFKFTD